MSTKVSVICTCYNHEKYIEQTLLSILNQTVDFEYELLIHDDCSPDNSRKIIDRVFNEYSGKCQIKRIYPEENIYSKGSSAVLFNMLPHVDGEYIAFCEGDDYWVDDNKLQKQLKA
ncbi:glycosyltransferase, partial [Vibrio parahaemolyticus]|uniref:glycosyltransferase family 2 protein n=1 Tax=Vibrio parahaemolyticus TaxID=670 RepID=UPI00146EA53A